MHLYPFSTGGKHGLMDARGKVVVRATYELTGLAGGEFTYARVHNDRLYFDGKGKKLFQRPIFTPVEFGDDGAGATWAYDDETGRTRAALMWPTGKQVLVDADDVWTPSDGLAPARADRGSDSPDGSGWWTGTGGFGYVDLRGKWKIAPKFHAAGPFDRGHAPAATLVKGKPRWGVIDKRGAWTCKPTYDQVVPAGDGWLSMRTDKEWGAIDPHGKVIVKPMFAMPVEWSGGIGTARFGKGGGFLDERGGQAITLRFEDVAPGVGGAWPVKVGGKWGLVDKRGEIVVKPTYASLIAFGELFIWSGPYRRTRPIDWGYVDPTGAVIYQGKR